MNVIPLSKFKPKTTRLLIDFEKGDKMGKTKIRKQKESDTSVGFDSFKDVMKSYGKKKIGLPDPEGDIAEKNWDKKISKS